TCASLRTQYAAFPHLTPIMPRRFDLKPRFSGTRSMPRPPNCTWNGHNASCTACTLRRPHERLDTRALASCNGGDVPSTRVRQSPHCDSGDACTTLCGTMSMWQWERRTVASWWWWRVLGLAAVLGACWLYGAGVVIAYSMGKRHTLGHVATAWR